MKSKISFKDYLCNNRIREIIKISEIKREELGWGALWSLGGFTGGSLRVDFKV